MFAKSIIANREFLTAAAKKKLRETVRDSDRYPQYIVFDLCLEYLLNSVTNDDIPLIRAEVTGPPVRGDVTEVNALFHSQVEGFGPVVVRFFSIDIEGLGGDWDPPAKRSDEWIAEKAADVAAQIIYNYAKLAELSGEGGTLPVPIVRVRMDKGSVAVG